MLTHSTQAVLLLTAHFSKPAAGGPRPLTPAEWGRFAVWLKAQGQTPAALLAGEPSRMLDGWVDEKVPAERICALLSRSPALALALERWQRAGLWVITRSDPDYPLRLKRLLRNSSPPLFFGCGNRQLLNRSGLAVVGSRNATEGDLDFAHQLGGEAAEAGYIVVSGGARGIDESAMQGALEREGSVVGVLSDRLLKAATSSKFRPALMARSLVLLSPFNPEAGFDVGNAMARNKYVYCLADAAVIVHSGTTGGTWSGALENLKHGWVPLWVKPSDDQRSGNAQLVEKGGRWLPLIESLPEIRQLFERPYPPQGPPPSSDSFGPIVTSTKAAVGEDQNGFEPTIAEEHVTALDNPTQGNEPPADEVFSPADAGVVLESGLPKEESEEWETINNMSFYEIFLRRMEILTAKEAKSPEQLQGELEICKTQLNAWLKRAVSEKRLRKLGNPVRYVRISPEPRPEQVSIFPKP
jgi:predicted Rossmann fold nucleotide-binding protein DprA/Smf involved in DNA uptake